jgi:hypothetical protein
MGQYVLGAARTCSSRAVRRLSIWVAGHAEAGSYFAEQRHTAADVSPRTVPTVRIPTGPPVRRSRTGSAAIEAAPKPLEAQHFAIGLWTAVCPETAQNPSQRRFVSQPLDFVGVRFRGSHVDL